MEVNEYDRASEFLTDYESILLQREAVSQLILFNAEQKRNSDFQNDGIFGVVTEEDLAILFFCNIKPFNLVIYAANQDKAVMAAASLADYIIEKHILINGITARNDICLSFIDQYKKHRNDTFAQKLGMDIMEIRKVNDIKPADGMQRLAREGDIKLIADWMIEFQLEALMSELDYEAAVKKVSKYINENKIYVFENSEKQVVTMATVARKLVNGVAIAYVYTPEEFRGKGYAATNMYYLSKELIEQGYDFCSLYVDKKNPLSNRAYEKVGYQILEDSHDYQLIPVE